MSASNAGPEIPPLSHWKRRDSFAFDCRWCDKTWYVDNPGNVRKRAVDHFHEEHGSDLRRTHDPIETIQKDGFHVVDNRYNVERITLYLTVFDIEDPTSNKYITPSDSDKVCKECATRITHGGPLEKIEDEPDSYSKDAWTCSACIAEEIIEQRQVDNYQLESFTDPTE